MPQKNLPVLTDLNALLRKLALEERELLRKLANLEDRVRQFEDFERPAYEAWLRLEFGPKLSALEEVYEQIRVLRITVHRIEELVDQGLHPREALYVASGRGAKKTEGEEPGSQGAWDAEEIEARRRAKKEAKREARREAKKEKRRAEKETASPSNETPHKSTPAQTSRSKLVSLYRALARKLHPDSAQAIASDRAQRLWLEVQDAYEASDYERLLAVAAWLGDDALEPGKANPASPLSLPERFERIRALGISKFKLQKAVGRLGEHPAWDFSKTHGAARRKIRQRAAREIGDELARAQDALTAYEDFITSIGPARPPQARRKK